MDLCGNLYVVSSGAEGKYTKWAYINEYLVCWVDFAFYGTKFELVSSPMDGVGWVDQARQSFYLIEEKEIGKENLFML